MHGGIQDFKKLSFENGFNEQNIYKTMIETKNDKLLNDEQIKTNSLFNETKILNTNNQNTNCLIEYFEGMMLNYISLYENRGENMDKLKSFILNNDNNDNNTNTKIKGSGGDSNFTKPINNVDIYNYLNTGLTNNEDFNNYLNFIDNYNGRIYITLINNLINDAYIIRIFTSDENTKKNDISLKINLQNNKIIDNHNGIYNEIYIGNEDDIYGNNLFITLLLEKILNKFLNYNCQKRYGTNGLTNAGFLLYKKKLNDEMELEELNKIAKESIVNIELKEAKIIIDSTISLLIIILTLRNNINKDIYIKYNYKYLLSSIYNSLFENSPFVFSGNNRNILTYRNKDNRISFGGDCALNTLLCVKKPELRELLMRKMNYVINNNNNITENYDEYKTKLQNILIQLNNDKTNVLISELSKYINDYKVFINKIDHTTNESYELNRELNKYINYMSIISDDNKKNEMFYQIYKELKENGAKLPNDFNFSRINELIRNKYQVNCDYILKNIEETCRLYNKFAYVFINNVMDINISDDIINKIVENNEKIKDVYDKFVNNNEIDLNDIISFKEMIDFMGDYKYYNIFYINLLISLTLVKEKIDYIFDDEIIDILKYSNDRSNFIKCFKNICGNRNELGIIFPTCDKYYNEKKYKYENYLFKFVSVEGAEHAVLSIIHVKSPGKYPNVPANCDIYIYDLNELYICCSEQFNENHWSTNKRINALYKINNTDYANKRWFLREYNNSESILNAYKKDEIGIAFDDITSHLCTFKHMYDNSITLISIVEKYNGLKLKINKEGDKLSVFDKNYNYNLNILFKV